MKLLRRIGDLLRLRRLLDKKIPVDTYANGVILVDPINVPVLTPVQLVFAKVLSKHFGGCEVKTYTDRLRDFVKYKMWVYRAVFAAGSYIAIVPGATNTVVSILETIKAYKSVKNHDDLLGYEIRGVGIGVPVIESYLRSGKYKIDLADRMLWVFFFKAVSLQNSFEKYVNKENVRALIISHDCYIRYDIPARVCYKFKIPVFFPNIYGVSISDKPHSLFEKKFSNSKEYFSRLSMERKVEAIMRSKEELARRFDGEVGVGMKYSTASAYALSNDDMLVEFSSEKPNVLIAVHDFFDNPHAYGGMIFPDFYQWLLYLAEISLSVDYSWYIKTHPDVTCESEEVVDCFCDKFPQFKKLNKRSNMQKIIQSGVDYVLTCYGTVGEEAPLLGATVINAGFNPRIDYSFNVHCLTKESYEYVLLDLPSNKIKVFSEDEVYVSYFMSRYFFDQEDFFLGGLLERYMDDTRLSYDSLNVIYDAINQNSSLLKDYERRIQIFFDNSSTFTSILD